MTQGIRNEPIEKVCPCGATFSSVMPRPVYCPDCDGESRRGIARDKEYRAARRTAVLAAYGDECACCGETTREFLAIDHINGGGREHRRQIGSGSTKLYTWLVKNGFPLGFRVLCHNCNSARGFYGYCPHERD